MGRGVRPRRQGGTPMTGVDRLHVARVGQLDAAAAAARGDVRAGHTVLVLHWAPPAASGAVPDLRDLPVVDLHPVRSWPVRALDVAALVRGAGPRRTQFHLRRSAPRRPPGAGAVGSAADPGGPLEVVDLTADDVAEVASLHLASFPESALTHLGFDGLHRYYRMMLVGDHPAALLGARRGGRLVGFAVVDPEASHLTDYLAARWWALGPRALLRADLLVDRAMRPRARIAGSLLTRRARLLVGRFGLRRRSAPPARSSVPVETGGAPVPDAGPSCSLLAIGVDPTLQGQGLGARLLAAAEDVARRRGYARIRCTVARDNVRARALYEGRGWREVDGGSAVQAKMQLVLAAPGRAAQPAER